MNAKRNPIEVRDLGCAELLLVRIRDGARWFWNPTNGLIRAWGSSQPLAHCKGNREMVSFVLSRN